MYRKTKHSNKLQAKHEVLPAKQAKTCSQQRCQPGFWLTEQVPFLVMCQHNVHSNFHLYVSSSTNTRQGTSTAQHFSLVPNDALSQLDFDRSAAQARHVSPRLGQPCTAVLQRPDACLLEQVLPCCACRARHWSCLQHLGKNAINRSKVHDVC